MEADHCAACKKPITGKAMKTKDQLYHEDNCFVCVVCQKDLKAVSVYSRDAKLYCEKHYKEKFVPKCADCGEYILDSCVKALDKTWHSEHFSCCMCNTNFSANQIGYHEHEGRAYCEGCFNKHALPQCKGCSNPIKDRTIKAMGGQWHIDCLKCKDCKCTFEGKKSFYSMEDQPICGPCAGIKGN